MSSEPFSNYLNEINKAYQRGDTTEHTHRPALKVLIEALGKRITATNEPKRIQCGAPDYIVSRRKMSLDRIRAHLIKNLSIEHDDFDILPVFTRHGGWGWANTEFAGKLLDFLRQLNEAVAA